MRPSETTPKPDAKVVILCGGRGRRLRPLTLDRPKALLPVANTSVLRRILEQLTAAGISAATVTLPHGAERHAARFGAAAPAGFDLELDIQGSTSGQVESLRRAVPRSRDTALVIYGDSLLSVDFRRLCDAHSANRSQGGLATMLYHRPADLLRAESAGRTYHGVLSVDERGRVGRFEEKPRTSELSPSFSLANAAVFLIERQLFDRPPFSEARNFSFDVFEPAVREGLPIYGFDVGSGYRFDIGSVQRWFELNVSVIRRTVDAHISGVEVRPGIWLADGATTNDVELRPPVLLGGGVTIGAGGVIGPEVVIGDDCRIGENVAIQRTVIMSDCTIGAGVELESCAIGPHCRVAGGSRLPEHTCLGAYCVYGGETWPNWARGDE